ncbi:MAG: hypothetical protein EOM14_14995, partial [Clostridia bacterium]|nr:hypothetical protein [Clostridia bacterium]
MMREDFAAFILTHGRADRVDTFKTLRNCGYTGKTYIVIDDEDKAADEYRKRYGDMVLQFGKADISKTFDEGDNFNDRRAIIYARNACFDLARQVGVKYFVELDDDYTDFRYKVTSKNQYINRALILNLDSVFESLLEFFEESKVSALAIAQGGDFIGGVDGNAIRNPCQRKCMNSFFCSIERAFHFVGRINEDVNTYVGDGRKGRLFLTFHDVALQQKATQSNSGGMTELYLDSGTYVKSFYTVMYAPSSTKVKVMQSKY